MPSQGTRVLSVGRTSVSNSARICLRLPGAMFAAPAFLIFSSHVRAKALNEASTFGSCAAAGCLAGRSQMVSARSGGAGAGGGRSAGSWHATARSEQPSRSDPRHRAPDLTRTVPPPEACSARPGCRGRRARTPLADLPGQHRVLRRRLTPCTSTKRLGTTRPPPRPRRTASRGSIRCTLCATTVLPVCLILSCRPRDQCPLPLRRRRTGHLAETHAPACPLHFSESETWTTNGRSHP